jgi:type IV pilus assembly protein PilB
MQNTAGILDSVENQFNDDDLNALDVESADRIDNAPIVKLCTTIVENSFRADATDIHIEPFKTFTRIRIRVNGDLIELMNVSNVVHNALVTRIKIISGMNIAEKRVPQDGRFSQVVDGTTLDVRVSNLPMVNGEKVVIRILSTGNVALRKITDLGMTDYNYERFSKLIKVPQGVMLVTGPTGSGKTTTLYAALGELAKPNVNVVTVEDPVEKDIEGINQCQVNAKAGMTFAAALRSILRQDPDIVMIGEMRDQETAEIAIRAAITGNMVLSTLHTNDSASTVTRLVDMGVAPYMVATSLIGIVAQRLVKKICHECRTPRLSSPEENELMGIPESITIYDACGCPKCNNTGYTGRTAIHEVLTCTTEMSSLIANGGKTDAIAELAAKQGTKLLRDNVSELVQAGNTTMDELVRVTYAV